jgi:hypothetical protein
MAGLSGRTKEATMRNIRVICVCLTAALALGLAAGCSRSRLTKENYDRIATGMSPADVEGIMGKGTEQAASSVAVPSVSVAGVHVGGASTSTKVLLWQEGRKVISVTFVNDKVMTKTQFGL